MSKNNPESRTVWPFIPSGVNAAIVVESPSDPDAVVRIQAMLNGVPAGEATEYNDYAARQLVQTVQAQIDAGPKGRRKPDKSAAREAFDALEVGDAFILNAQFLYNKLRVKVGPDQYIDPTGISDGYVSVQDADVVDDPKATVVQR